MLTTILMILFVISTLFLALFILIQQGKGDMGMGSLSGSTQMLFGGSGGQTFFEKGTWILGAIFMLGALGLSVLKSREVRDSRLGAFAASGTASTQKQNPTTRTHIPAAEKTESESSAE